MKFRTTPRDSNVLPDSAQGASRGSNPLPYILGRRLGPLPYWWCWLLPEFLVYSHPRQPDTTVIRQRDFGDTTCSDFRGSTVHSHEKQFSSKLKELRRFRDHCWKDLNEENSDLPGIFLCNSFSPMYFSKQLSKECPNKNIPGRFGVASLNPLVPCAEVSRPSEEPCFIGKLFF